jgi:hypothetical protein
LALAVPHFDRELTAPEICQPAAMLDIQAQRAQTNSFQTTILGLQNHGY